MAHQQFMQKIFKIWQIIIDNTKILYYINCKKQLQILEAVPIKKNLALIKMSFYLGTNIFNNLEKKRHTTK